VSDTTLCGKFPKNRLNKDTMKAIHLLLALMLICLLPAHAKDEVGIARNAALPEKVDIFSAGDDGVAHYRIPGVVVTPEGTVLAYCEARRKDRKDFGEIEIHMRRSTDGGKTWEPAKQIAHSGERIEGNPRAPEGGKNDQTVNNPVAIVDHKTGAIEFLYCVNYARAFSMRSTDDGKTWSEPVEITETFEAFRDKYDWKVIATGPGHGIQLRTGRLVVPVWLAYGEEGAHNPSASGTIYSDDHGKTWSGGEIAVPDEEPFINPNETMAAELSNGSVMLVVRSLSHPNRKIVTTSADGATSWAEPSFHPELWEPRCMATILSISSQPGTLLFSNPHNMPLDEAGNEIPGGRATRRNLSIKLSRDDGKTWPVSRTLESGPSAYSDLAELPDGSFLCFYEKGHSLTVARFTLDWLENETPETVE
jgi:sialidase-1